MTDPTIVREIDVRAADQRRAAGATLIDVREPVEWDAGHIPDAVFIPLGQLGEEIGAAVPDKGTEIILQCRSGARSGRGTALLQQLGYTNVVNMTGGILEWQANDLPIEAPATLTPAQQARYSRHLLIPEVGVNGQAKLLDSKVLIVGAGGLGSPSALYLAAAGVGTLGIVDFDVVEASNLQRQVIHSTERLGHKKVDSARQTIQALNPDVRVNAYDEMLLADNVERLIDGYDVILDGTDTFETRYLLNDAAVAAGIPVVHASVFRFEGQLTTFVPYVGPCYRCLYPTPPPPELAPGCSVAGVLGVVPGIMGLLQANEVLKVLLGIGEPLVGRLLLFDALDGAFSEVRLQRDPACPTCSDAARAARERGDWVAPSPFGADQPFVLGGIAGFGGAAQ
ncbi:MAG TPA: molybdopterin-synthase adenylyltransferase MoeB [Candidatus Limnocylindrales bacterium]|jgi:molybdopterin/thiamine biosynthesis adenylyltransferase/rhodanese-related sulfurtransferase